MDLSRVKMVVTDMDGTLLNSSHEVSQRFYELFERLDNLGITFVAASGRQYGSMASKLTPIADRITFIAENGSYVIKGDQELLATPLNKDIQWEILSLLEKTPETYPILCCRDQAYVVNPHKKFLHTLKEFYADYSLLEDIADFNEQVLKIAVYHYEDSEQHIYPVVKHLEKDLTVKVSGRHWVDLSDKNAHKGYALNKLQNKMGISPSQTLVLGDYKNDLEMLRAAEFSFAMANAHPEVSATAKYSTLSNDEFGVELVLEKILAAYS